MGRGGLGRVGSTGHKRKRMEPEVTHESIDEILSNRTTLAPYDPKCEGKPDEELRQAIIGFVKHEMTSAALRSFIFDFSGYSGVDVNIKADKQFAEFRGCGRIALYSDRVQMFTKNHAETVEYADPNLFDKIERFIHLLPVRLT